MYFPCSKTLLPNKQQINSYLIQNLVMKWKNKLSYSKEKKKKKHIEGYHQPQGNFYYLKIKIEVYNWNKPLLLKLVTVEDSSIMKFSTGSLFVISRSTLKMSSQKLTMEDFVALVMMTNLQLYCV